jgi:hypothetical protein
VTGRAVGAAAVVAAVWWAVQTALRIKRLADATDAGLKDVLAAVKTLDKLHGHQLAAILDAVHFPPAEQPEKEPSAPAAEPQPNPMVGYGYMGMMGMIPGVGP